MMTLSEECLQRPPTLHHDRKRQLAGDIDYVNLFKSKMQQLLMETTNQNAAMKILVIWRGRPIKKTTTI